MPPANTQRAEKQDQQDNSADGETPFELVFVYPCEQDGKPTGRRVAKRLAFENGAVVVKKASFPTFWVRKRFSVKTPREAYAVFQREDRLGGIPVPGVLKKGAEGIAAKRGTKQDELIDDGGHLIPLDFENEPLPLEMWDASAHDVGLWYKKKANIKGAMFGYLSASHREDGIARAHGFTIANVATTHNTREAYLGEFLNTVQTKEGRNGFIDDSVLAPSKLMFGPANIGPGVTPPPWHDVWFYLPGEGSERTFIPDKIELDRRRAVLETKRNSARQEAEAIQVEIEGVKKNGGGSWKSHLWELLARDCAGLFNAVQASCGAAITILGDSEETKKIWISETTAFLNEHVKPVRKEKRVNDEIAKLSSIWRGISAEERHKTVPRIENYSGPLTVSLSEGSRILDQEADRIADQYLTDIGKRENWMTARQIVLDGLSRALKLREKAEKNGKKIADLEKEISKEKDPEIIQLKKTIVRSLDKTAVKLARKAAELNKRAWRYGSKAKVLNALLVPGPDGELFEVAGDTEAPQVKLLQVWENTVGLGKTRHAFSVAKKLIEHAPDRRRVAYYGATANLCQDIEPRVKALISPKALRFAHYLGEARPDPHDPTRTACPRSGERTALRKAGLVASALCGSAKVGFCAFNPKNEAEDAPTPCHYHLQRPATQFANFVTISGASVLGDAPIKWISRESVTITRFDPVQRRRRKITVPANPFDLVIFDETDLKQLEETEANAAENARKPCEAPLASIFDAEVARGPSRRILNWRPGEGPDAQPEDNHVARAMAQDLPEIARVAGLIAQAADLLAEGEYISYGALYAALGPSNAGRRAQAFHELRRQILGLKISPAIDPSANMKIWLTTEHGREFRRWNSLRLYLARLFASAARAIERHEGAPEEEQSGYLRRVSTARVTGQGRVPGLAARKVIRVHKDWLAGLALILDANYRPAIYANFFPEPDKVLKINVETPDGVANVRQVTDRSFSYSWMDDAIAAAEKAEKEADKGKLGTSLAAIAHWLEIGAYLGGSRGALAVMPMKLEAALLKWWATNGGKPENLETAHFHAIRGIDRWRNVGWCGIVGRPQAPVEAIADRYALLDGVPDPAIAGRYEKTYGVYPMADKPGFALTLKAAQPIIRNPLAEELRASDCDDELNQVAGRLRLIRRTKENPVIVDILTKHPVPGIKVNQMELTQDFLAPASDPWAIAEARGFLLDDSYGASAVVAAVCRLSERGVRQRKSRQKQKVNDNMHQKTEAKCEKPLYIYREGYIGVGEVLAQKAANNGWQPIELKLKSSSKAPVLLQIKGNSLEEARARFVLATGFEPASFELQKMATPERAKGGRPKKSDGPGYKGRRRRKKAE